MIDSLDIDDDNDGILDVNENVAADGVTNGGFVGASADGWLLSTGTVPYLFGYSNLYVNQDSNGTGPFNTIVYQTTPITVQYGQPYTISFDAGRVLAILRFLMHSLCSTIQTALQTTCTWDPSSQRAVPAALQKELCYPFPQTLR